MDPGHILRGMEIGHFTLGEGFVGNCWVIGSKAPSSSRGLFFEPLSDLHWSQPPKIPLAMATPSVASCVIIGLQGVQSVVSGQDRPAHHDLGLRAAFPECPDGLVHAVQGRGHEGGQPHQFYVLLHGFAGHVFHRDIPAQIDDVKAVILQDHFDDVLADIVDVARRGQKDAAGKYWLFSKASFSLSFQRLPGPRWPLQSAGAGTACRLNPCPPCPGQDQSFPPRDWHPWWRISQVSPSRFSPCRM